MFCQFRKRTIVCAFVLYLSPLFVACGSDESAPTHTENGAATQFNPSLDCSGLGDRLSVGLTKTSASGELNVEILAFSPAPPTQGDNAWTIALRDATGNLIESAALLLDVWMSNRAYGANKDVIVSELGDGRYKLAPIYLSMPGLWEISLIIGESSDSVSFQCCVEQT